MLKPRNRVSELSLVLVALFTLTGGHAYGAENGQETVWLDSLDLTTMRQDWGEPQVNRSIRGQPLSLGGKRFERGVGTHASSNYRLMLAGGTRKFEATVGLDDGARGPGSVVFQVVADGINVFDSGVMRSNSPPQPVSVDLRGVKSLLLTVTDAGDGFLCDHADWADARFYGLRGQADAGIHQPA